MRHTVVIGIGGSGKWVVTYLKKMLEDTNNNTVPPEVALIALDLAGDEDPPVQIEVMGEGKKIIYKLDFGEHSPHFHQFSGKWAEPIYNISNAPNGNDFSAIRKWLKSDDADLYIIGPSDRTSIPGTGQRRQTSRISLFLDLEQGGTYDRIRNTINSAAQNLPAGESLTIHVVGSLAGGTGSGTFIDIASLAQNIALDRLVGGQINLIGYFVLPKSFEGVANDKSSIPLMEGSCCAALRELQRFMHITSIPIEYPTPIKTVINQTRLFDFCYLIDGGRPASSSGKDMSDISPRLGVLPGIADFIFHHIVYPYPTDYAQVQNGISQNLSTQFRPQGSAIYSSFGVYQYIFDAQGVIDTLAHKLALDVLKCFLEPSQKSGTEISEEVHDFLRAEGARVFDQTVNTYLGGTTASNVAEEILFSMLRLGENRDKTLPVLNFDQIQTRTLLRSIDSTTVKKQAEDLIARHKGNPEDISVGRQSYYSVLTWYQNEHARLFKERIQGKVLDILREHDGRSDLRHALLFLRRLAGYNERIPGAPGEQEKTQYVEGEYDRFMELIRNIYTTQFEKLKAQARESASLAEGHMMNQNNGSAQKQYLKAKQTELKFDQQELVFNTVMAVAKDRKDICANLRDQVESWLYTFEEGERVMSKAHTELVEVRKDRASVKVRKYVSLPEDAFESRLYDLLVKGSKPSAQEEPLLERLMRVDMQSILRDFSWRYRDETLECALPAEYAPWSELKSNPLRWNYQFVRTLLGKGYFQKVTDITVMDVLALNEITAREVCDTLSLNSTPMATLNLANHPPTRNWNTVYLPKQANAPGASLAQEINNTLGNINPNTSLTQHVISCYQVYHLLGMEAFTTLKDIERVYRERLKIDPNTNRHIPPPLHTFLAEKHATRYEQLFPDALGEQVRNLNIRVVHLLDDEQAVETFTLAMLNNLIKIQFSVSRNQNEYIFDPPQGGQGKVLGTDMISCVHTISREQDIRETLYDLSVQNEQNKINQNGLDKYGNWLLEQIQTALYLQYKDDSPESDLKRVMKIILWKRAQQRLKAASSTSSPLSQP